MKIAIMIVTVLAIVSINGAEGSAQEVLPRIQKLRWHKSYSKDDYERKPNTPKMKELIAAPLHVNTVMLDDSKIGSRDIDPSLLRDPERERLLELTRQAYQEQEEQSIINALHKDDKSFRYDDEDINPNLRSYEIEIAHYIFKHYLIWYDLKNWMTHVFNNPLLSRDDIVVLAFNILFPEEMGIRTFIDKQNFFFVRNYEYFNYLFALLSQNARNIEQAAERYNHYKTQNKWLL